LHRFATEYLVELPVCGSDRQIHVATFQVCNFAFQAPDLIPPPKPKPVAPTPSPTLTPAPLPAPPMTDFDQKVLAAHPVAFWDVSAKGGT